MERTSVNKCDECESREIEDIKLYVHVCVFMYQTTNYLFLKVARYGLLLRTLKEMYKKSNFLPKVCSAWRQTDKGDETLGRGCASYSFPSTDQKQTNANVLETSFSIYILPYRSCFSGVCYYYYYYYYYHYYYYCIGKIILCPSWNHICVDGQLRAPAIFLRWRSSGCHWTGRGRAAVQVGMHQRREQCAVLLNNGIKIPCFLRLLT